MFSLLISLCMHRIRSRTAFLVQDQMFEILYHKRTTIVQKSTVYIMPCVYFESNLIGYMLQETLGQFVAILETMTMLSGCSEYATFLVCVQISAFIMYLHTIGHDLPGTNTATLIISPQSRSSVCSLYQFA